MLPIKFNETPNCEIEQIEFNKDGPYIVDFTVLNTITKNNEQITGYTIS